MDWKSRVLPCHCLNKYQDEKYGPGQRLHTAQGAKNENKFRCTVCGNSRGGS